MKSVRESMKEVPVSRRDFAKWAFIPGYSFVDTLISRNESQGNTREMLNFILPATAYISFMQLAFTGLALKTVYDISEQLFK